MHLIVASFLFVIAIKKKWVAVGFEFRFMGLKFMNPAVLVGDPPHDHRLTGLNLQASLGDLAVKIGLLSKPSVKPCLPTPA